MRSLFGQRPNRGLSFINGASLRDACKMVVQKNIHRTHKKDGSKYAQYLMGHQPDVKDWYSSQMWERACSWIEVEKRDYRKTWIWSARRSATLCARFPPLLILELIFEPPWFLFSLSVFGIYLHSIPLSLSLNLWYPDAPCSFKFHLSLDCPSSWKPHLILDRPIFLILDCLLKGLACPCQAETFSI